jgi:hypothetical protein
MSKPSSKMRIKLHPGEYRMLRHRAHIILPLGVLLAVAIFLTVIPTAWATPNESVLSQQPTIPTVPPPPPPPPGPPGGGIRRFRRRLHPLQHLMGGSVLLPLRIWLVAGYIFPGLYYRVLLLSAQLCLPKRLLLAGISVLWTLWILLSGRDGVLVAQAV